MIIDYDDWSWLTYIMVFISSVFSTIAVPLFFFISGFLFFYNVDFSRAVYEKKLRSRSRTLLVPYLIWNFAGFLILLVQLHPRFLPQFPMLKDYRIDISGFLSYFWVKNIPDYLPGEQANPINAPLWFIRDLMMLSIATPLIYWLIKRLKVIFILIMGIIWLFSLGKHSGLSGNSHQSIFFFPLGAYFSIYHINFVELANKAKWAPLLYVVFAIADTVTFEQPYNYWLHYTGILIGLIAMIHVVSELIRRERITTSKFLSDASFFVFALHGLFISRYVKLLIMIFRPGLPYAILFIYFFVPVTTIMVCLGLYKLLNNYMPTVAKIVTGGR